VYKKNFKFKLIFKDVFEEQNNQRFVNSQQPLDQVMKNTSMKTSIQNNQQQRQTSSPSTSHIAQPVKVINGF